MKKLKSILIILFIGMLTLTTTCYATKSVDDIMGSADDFVSSGSSDVALDIGQVQDVSDLIYNTLFIIGVIVAVIISAFLGIKFMTSGVEEQAKVKEALIPFIIGCVVVFGSLTIWKIVLQILEG